MLLSTYIQKLALLKIIVMHQKVTVWTQPCQIVQFIIFAVPVNVVCGKYPNIVTSTQDTLLCDTATHQHISVGFRISSSFPVWVLSTNKLGVLPSHTTPLATKPLLAL
jgi:hypothetical protein